MEAAINMWRCSRCGVNNISDSCTACGSNRRQNNPVLGLINNGNYSGQVGGNVYNVHGPMQVVDKWVDMGGSDFEEVEEHVTRYPALPPPREEVEEPKRDGVKNFCRNSLYIGSVGLLWTGLGLLLMVFVFFGWLIFSAISHAQMVG